MGFSAEFDETAFIAAVTAAAKEGADRYGFATARPGTVPLSPKKRRQIVAARTHAAQERIVDLQQMLVDDDMEVRDLARNGLRDVMLRIYTGDVNQHDHNAASLPWPDRLLRRLLPRGNEDGPEPWWAQRSNTQRARQRWAQLCTVAAVFSATVATSAALAFGKPVIALPCLLIAGLMCVGEDAFARAVGLRSATLRWFSCVAGHLGDLGMITAISFFLFVNSHRQVAAIVAASVLVGLFGSFVRVSALQAGYRFWVSSQERILRYLSVVFFCLSALNGHFVLGGLVTAALVSGYGLWESAYVPWKVLRGPRLRSGGMIFWTRGEDGRGYYYLEEDQGEPARLSGKKEKSLHFARSGN